MERRAAEVTSKLKEVLHKNGDKFASFVLKVPINGFYSKVAFELDTKPISDENTLNAVQLEKFLDFLQSYEVVKADFSKIVEWQSANNVSNVEMYRLLGRSWYRWLKAFDKGEEIKFKASTISYIEQQTGVVFDRVKPYEKIAKELYRELVGE